VDVSKLVDASGYFIKTNKSTILTAVGVLGTISTAVLTGRATVLAYDRVRDEYAAREYEAREELMKTHGPDFDVRSVEIQMMNMWDKFRLCWVDYIPPVGVGAATIVAIIFANKVEAHKAAAMAAAYGVSERAFEEYKAKVAEKLGEKRELAIRDEIAQDRVSKDPPVTREVIMTDGGKVLCKDNLTGRYFESSTEAIRRAENKINQEIIQHNFASLSQFYDLIGLPATRYSDEVGWNSFNGKLLEVTFSTTLTQDEKPCLLIDFTIGPTEEYHKLW
jgi:Family of unknown function (DUF6353)